MNRRRLLSASLACALAWAWACALAPGAALPTPRADGAVPDGAPSVFAGDPSLVLAPLAPLVSGREGDLRRASNGVGARRPTLHPTSPALAAFFGRPPMPPTVVARLAHAPVAAPAAVSAGHPRSSRGPPLLVA